MRSFYFLMLVWALTFIPMSNCWSQRSQQRTGAASPATEKKWFMFGDLVATPLMGYTINRNFSNVPTYFLLSKGFKGNLGLELGFMRPIAGHAQDASTFFIIGCSFHAVGFSYGGKLINLSEEQNSNHRHSRAFLGIKLIPLDQFKYFTISATTGLGLISTNLANKNVDGKLQASSGDFSISFTLDVSKFSLK
jgi:hypothetical protein